MVRQVVVGDVGADGQRPCVATAGSPIVFTPGPLLPAEMNDLHVVLLDQAVVEHGPGVVAVVERREPADRHVDDVDVALLGDVRHALDERVRRCSRR